MLLAVCAKSPDDGLLDKLANCNLKLLNFEMLCAHIVLAC